MKGLNKRHSPFLSENAPPSPSLVLCKVSEIKKAPTIPSVRPAAVKFEHEKYYSSTDHSDGFSALFLSVKTRISRRSTFFIIMRVK